MADFTLTELNQAVASAVSAAVPGVNIYDNPNQEGTELPAVFITYRGEQLLERQIGNRWMRTVRFDVVYMEELNAPNMGDLYRAAAESLDYALDTVPLSDGTPLRVLNRSWFVELDALHYQFDVKVRVAKPETANYIKTLNLTEELK